MAGTPSPLAQPTGLHCSGAGGWLSPSDPLQLLALITALCPYTVQMGPFVGLSWSLGVMGRGQAGESRRGLPWGFTLSFKEGRETQNTGPENRHSSGRLRENPFYTQHCSAGFVAGIYYHLKLEDTWLSCMGDDTERERESHSRVWVTWQAAGRHWLQMFSLLCLDFNSILKSFTEASYYNDNLIMWLFSLPIFSVFYVVSLSLWCWPCTEPLPRFRWIYQA